MGQGPSKGPSNLAAVWNLCEHLLEQTLRQVRRDTYPDITDVRAKLRQIVQILNWMRRNPDNLLNHLPGVIDPEDGTEYDPETN